MPTCLIMVSRCGPGRRFDLVDGRNVIGRSYRCDVRIPLPSIGLQHCVVEVESSRVATASPFRPEHVVLVNDQPIGGDHRLFAGDIVQIGPVRFRFDHAIAPSRPIHPVRLPQTRVQIPAALRYRVKNETSSPTTPPSSQSPAADA